MPDATKAALREQVRSRRRRRDPAERAAVADRLAAVVLGLPEVVAAAAAGGIVTAYASYGTEPGTGPLLAGLRSSGARVLLPVVLGSTLAWAWYEGPQHLEVSGRGIPEPVGPRAAAGAAGAAVLLIPALAAGVDGRRLGKGGGYYDRVLAGLPRQAAGGPWRVAVVHDDDVLPAGLVPVAPHDEPVDAIVTDARVVRVRLASR